MGGLTAAALLDVWVLGQSMHPIDRALTLLSGVEPGASTHELASLDLGKRDQKLIELRESMFGHNWEAVTTCTVCGEQLEFSLGSLGRHRGESGESRRDDPMVQGSEWREAIRPLNSYDLAAIVGLANRDDIRTVLAARCLAENGNQAPLSPDQVAEIAGALSEIDPDAETLVSLTCPACEHQWQSVLDVQDFVWREVASEARWLLADIAALAGAFGWSESDILAMSPVKRRLYVEMAAG